MIYFIIIVNVLLAFKLWWDYRAKNKGRIINHGLSAGIDGLIYVISAWFLFGFDAGGWIVIAIGYRWIFFDLLFNKLNGWKWNHYGRSSWQDRQLKKLGKYHLIPKFALIIIGIIIIFI